MATITGSDVTAVSAWGGADREVGRWLIDERGTARTCRTRVAASSRGLATRTALGGRSAATHASRGVPAGRESAGLEGSKGFDEA